MDIEVRTHGPHNALVECGPVGVGCGEEFLETWEEFGWGGAPVLPEGEEGVFVEVGVRGICGIGYGRGE